MKKRIAILLAMTMMFGCTAPVAAQQGVSTDTGITALSDENNHAYDPFAEIEAKQDEEEYRESVEYEEGKVLFTLRDYRADGAAISYINDSNDICKAVGLKNVSMIYETKSKNAEVKDGYTAYDVYYEAVTTKDVWTVVDTLNERDDVVIAEPDYTWQTAEVGDYAEASGDEIQMESHFSSLGITDIWNQLKSDLIAPGEDVVVAVIDTGVDYTHKDLADNMWQNPFEIPGNGIDDDGNGYVDDVYGINLIDNSGDPMDDHGHGTHVAGIIDMTPGNGGGVGIAYASKIMAIKAGQSNGNFASSDIAKAVNYALSNGADVINMSFGGTGKSAVVESVLSDAFGSCVLVASAGNDGAATTDAPISPKEDIYPAGYNYVLGVMASNGITKASFSNWDYAQGVNCEYELIAPGVNIYSTLPGDRYALWSGTSMAAPMVSAAAAIIRSKYPNKSKYSSRYIMGQLSSATDKYVTYIDNTGRVHMFPSLDILDALYKSPEPSLTLSDINIFDSTDIDSANNGDGIVQPGEVIDLSFNIWNRWGIASDVTVTADALYAAGIANKYVSFVTDSVSVDDVGTFASVNNGYVYTDDVLTGVSKPIRLKISEDAPNDLQITINLTATAKNGMDDSDSKTYSADNSYTLIVQNGYALSGNITEDMTLTSDKYWIIENNVRIPEGVTVTVEPGTQIQFWSADPSNIYGDDAIVYIQVEGKFICNGTEDKPIEMFPGKGYEDYCVQLRGKIITSSDILDNDKDSTYTSLNYVNVINPGSEEVGGYFAATDVNHCTFTQNYNTVKIRYSSSGKVYTSNMFGCTIYAANVKNSVFNYIRGSSWIETTYADSVLFNKCRTKFDDTYNDCSTENSVFLINNYNTGSSVMQIDTPIRSYKNNAMLNNLNDTSMDSWLRITPTSRVENAIDYSGNYWGTDNATLVKKQVYDTDWNVSLADIIQEPYLTLDSTVSDCAVELAKMYPFVTDVYLTDTDGNKITDVSGSQEVNFHVLFNRDMATDVQPTVSYGGASPYTDYMVTGDWTSSHEWVGTVNIDPFINQGRMYIKVKGAAAADDKWLVTGDDEGRFFFDVTNTGAESLTLQGNGELGKNALSWVQDDYDTLAGYNIYRSLTYDKNTDVSSQAFKKINTSVVANSTYNYEDINVEPSVDYYYYFTVVDTDFNESEPSNVVMCTPLDGDAPTLTVTDIADIAVRNAVLVKAESTDNVAVTAVKLYYKMKGDTDWQSANMLLQNGTYMATIPATATRTRGVMEYYITSTDGTNTTTYGTADEPKHFNIGLIKGDVDNNGVVDLLDVIAVMKHIGDGTELTVPDAAEVDGTDGITQSDAATILKYSANIIKQL